MVHTALSVFALTVATLASSRPVESFLAPSVALSRAASGIRSSSVGVVALRMEYVPDGLTPEEWKKMQKKEAERKKGLDLGHVGVNKFKSRSLQAWQEAGADHLFPVNPKKVKSGEIPQEKTPYMQRGGGAWDDSDLAKKNLKSQEGKRIEKKKWSKLDKAYAAGGAVKGSNAPISPGNLLPWTKLKPSGGDDKRNAGGRQKAGGAGTKRAKENPQTKNRLANEAALKKKKTESEAKMKAQLKSEGKKGLFGLW